MARCIPAIAGYGEANELKRNFQTGGRLRPQVFQVETQCPHQRWEVYGKGFLSVDAIHPSLLTTFIHIVAIPPIINQAVSLAC